MPDEKKPASDVDAASEPPPDPPSDDEVAEPANDRPPEKANGKILVVGIGASAGGLEAIGELIRHLPTEGVAYIVVQHLAPDHESLLTQLLARGSPMQVVTATDGVTLAPNHVYVIPPAADIAVMHDVIRIMTPSGGQRPHLPVDYLFRSLAEDQGHSAIGVVLSGTGTDGTLGLEAIRAAGGFTFCQGEGHGRWNRQRRRAAPLRPILADTQGGAGGRPGPAHRQRNRRGPWRTHLGREPGWGGYYVLFYAAPRGLRCAELRSANR
jgi:two-component system CheB/CheR fusion protein